MTLSNPYFQFALVILISIAITFVASRRNFNWLHLCMLLFTMVMLAFDVYNLAVTLKVQDIVLTSLVAYLSAISVCNILVNAINRREKK